MLLLRGKAYSALDNQSRATIWYKAALQSDPFCYDAFKVLCAHTKVNSWLFTTQASPWHTFSLLLRVDQEWGRISSRWSQITISEWIRLHLVLCMLDLNDCFDDLVFPKVSIFKDRKSKKDVWYPKGIYFFNNLWYLGWNLRSWKLTWRFWKQYSCLQKR